MGKYDPERFEILGITNYRKDFFERNLANKKYVNTMRHNIDRTTHSRSEINKRAAIVLDNINDITFYTVENHQRPLKPLYAKILIKNLDLEQSCE